MSAADCTYCGNDVEGPLGPDGMHRICALRLDLAIGQARLSVRIRRHIDEATPDERARAGLKERTK